MAYIMVFGSNLRGRMGKGAALVAVKKWGAREGVGEGRTGNSYALPTKDYSIKTLPLDEIRGYVDRFLRHAHKSKEDTFLVTEIGCGLAGYTPEQIAPMFNSAFASVKDLPNVYLPERFLTILKLPVSRMSFYADNQLYSNHAVQLTGMV